MRQIGKVTFWVPLHWSFDSLFESSSKLTANKTLNTMHCMPFVHGIHRWLVEKYLLQDQNFNYLPNLGVDKWYIMNTFSSF